MLRGWGGQSNRIHVEAMGAARAGHEVAFAVPHSSKLAAKAREAGCEVWPDYEFRPLNKPWIFFPDLRRFRKDVAAWKPDLIHLHGSQDTWIGVLAKSLSGGGFPPLIRTKHNIFEWHMNPPNRWLYSRIDAYISISGFIDRQVEQYPVTSIQPRALIHSVPDTERLYKECPDIRGELTTPSPDTFLWGSTGRLRSEKAFDVLLHAFARVHEREPRSHLVIAGDGSDRTQLESLARELALDSSVTFLGFRQDIPGILKSLDAYVLTSRSEGLGTAILEALAVGLPVVATNVGGIPDSVHHGETGLLAGKDDVDEIAAAMLRIMHDKGLRERLGTNARRLVSEQFTEEALIEKTLSFYEKVLEMYRQ